MCRLPYFWTSLKISFLFSIPFHAFFGFESINDEFLNQAITYETETIIHSLLCSLSKRNLKHITEPFQINMECADKFINTVVYQKTKLCFLGFCKDYRTEVQVTICSLQIEPPAFFFTVFLPPFLGL